MIGVILHLNLVVGVGLGVIEVRQTIEVEKSSREDIAALGRRLVFLLRQSHLFYSSSYCSLILPIMFMEL